eukprot:jgi/Ulvmu1/1074/UM105_0033.1
MSPSRSIAVVFAPQGGMGDVGKYVVAHGLKMANVTVKPIALTSKATAEAKFDFEVDVQPQALQDELRQVFENVSPAQIVLEDPGAQHQLEQQFEGVDAVIACIGSRQPGKKFPELKSRWCKAGAEMVAAAMQATSVSRLLLLSSFGIHDDFLPMSVLKALWGAMLSTSLRAAKKDLLAMEDHITASGLDYVLVKPMGLTPEAPPTGKWKAVTARGQGGLGLSVAKSDVAQFMLSEAIEPRLHWQSVTVGS